MAFTTNDERNKKSIYHNKKKKLCNDLLNKSISNNSHEKKEKFYLFSDKQEKIKSKEVSSNLDAGNLRGITKYIDYRSGFRRECSTNSEKGLESHGPQKSSLHFRNSIRFDYQPDICKDFKETGYCGYGDACKFSHDRCDYKFGWQIEKEFRESINKRIKDNHNELNTKDHFKANSLPLACLICRRPWEENSVYIYIDIKYFFCDFYQRSFFFFKIFFIEKYIIVSLYSIFSI